MDLRPKIKMSPPFAHAFAAPISDMPSQVERPGSLALALLSSLTLRGGRQRAASVRSRCGTPMNPGAAPCRGAVQESQGSAHSLLSGPQPQPHVSQSMHEPAAGAPLSTTSTRSERPLHPPSAPRKNPWRSGK